MASRTQRPTAKAEARQPTARPLTSPKRGASTGQAAEPPAPADRRTALARGIVRLLQAAVVDADELEIVLGSPRPAGPGQRPAQVASVAPDARPLVPVMGPPPARATVVLRGADAVARLVFPPTPDHLAEAFLRGDLDIEGDVAAAVGAAELLDLRRLGVDGLRRLGRWSLELRRGTPGAAPLARIARLTGPRHSPDRDMAAARFHYDVGNDFFSLWLDRRLTYSSALFPDGTTAADAARLLDEAQEAKLELICRKLRLGANRRLLDIGSGWGSLVTYAGERHAALAVGVTLSEPQAARAEAQARGAGLVGRVHTEVRDYRDLAPLGTYDAVASVGMVEHVGRANLPVFYRAAFEAVRPGGLVLCHGIMASGPPAPRLGPDLRPGTSHFRDRYVFPDGELLPVEDHLARAREAGFEVVDVQSLRPHYALTLAAWVARLEARWAEAVAAAGEEVARTWRLYMSAGRLGFERGDLDVCQLLLARPGEDGRTDLPPSPWW